MSIFKIMSKSVRKDLLNKIDNTEDLSEKYKVLKDELFSNGYVTAFNKKWKLVLCDLNIYNFKSLEALSVV